MNPRLKTLRFTTARYIAGLLTPEEQRQLETDLRENPDLVAEFELADHLTRAMALLDTGPVEQRSSWWQRRGALVAALACIALLVIALGVVSWRWDVAVDRQRVLEAQAERGFLVPTTRAETVRIDPEASDRYDFGGASPARVELHIAVRTLKFNQFRLNLAGGDGSFVAQMNRMVRDSNGNLRLALNSSLLPPGEYELRVEGITWRGEGVPLKRVALVVRR